MGICHSPQLFAAYHVFHRLLVPRHPPCALFAFFVEVFTYLLLSTFFLVFSDVLMTAFTTNIYFAVARKRRHVTIFDRDIFHCQYSVFKVLKAKILLLRKHRFINASHLFITGVRRTPFCLFISDLVRINALDRLCPSRVPSSFCLRGDGEIRTHDPLLARQVLSQLSYTPVCPDLVSGQDFFIF